MADFLILSFDAPLQAWGDIATDQRRPTRPFPSRSALAGLFANALGWRHHQDTKRTTQLQDALRYAVREERVPQVVVDFQTANLRHEDAGGIGQEGWTRWGIERRGGTVSTDAEKATQILRKHYLADGRLCAAVTFAVRTPVSLDQAEAALRRPARPLFLGRKGCPPGGPILIRRVPASTAVQALKKIPLPKHADPPSQLRVWYPPGDGPEPHSPAQVQEVWDRRDYQTQRFLGSRRLIEGIWSDVGEAV